jgi:dTDP-4-amino-4,6-dideoxygalactose transaminase
MSDAIVRLSRSTVGVEEQQALAEVIAEGYLGMGRFTQRFEQELTEYFGGAREVVCVSTGTAALQLALQSVGVGAGDEVLVPGLTFVASYQAISATGAKPVACEVHRENGFLDAADAARRITPRTRAIMPVHYASIAPGLPAIYQLARERGLRVVEDAAHSFGCSVDGKRVGVDGDVVCFSFDGIKNITCGEGGAIVTSDARAAARARDARLLAVEKDTEKRYSGDRSWDFEVTDQGWRYHLSNLLAAIGSAQLKKLPQFAARRQALLQRYRADLGGVAGCAPLQPADPGLVPHIFVLRVFDGRREALLAALRGEGIECGLHYKPNHLLKRFRTDYSLPNVEALCGEVVSLPMHASLTDVEQARVVDVVRRFLKS